MRGRVKTNVQRISFPVSGAVRRTRAMLEMVSSGRRCETTMGLLSRPCVNENHTENTNYRCQNSFVRQPRRVRGWSGLCPDR